MGSLSTIYTHADTLNFQAATPIAVGEGINSTETPRFNIRIKREKNTDR